ncbi:hypothetical protein [Ruminococcus sp. Marseille-P6503]|uniref:hypothetical protein n=1 Tax=Ruminococcus sp. Marseille-P6503 TaxID=2364796 RepID=UPI000F53A21A|nr:hypothetical protein [Ruminococcus sp. Marseille-P6503]
MKLRRLNRGLILGAVLIVGTVSYVVYDTSRFNQSRDEIQNAVESYFDSMAQANKSGKDSMTDSCRNLINEEWAYDKSMEDFYYCTKDSLLDSIEASEKEDFSTGYITEFECSPSNFNINKNGPDGAVVTLELDAYIEFYGSPYALAPDGFSQLDNNNYENTDEGYMCNPDDSIKYRSSQNYSEVSVCLKKSDGEWKITAVDYYSWSGDTEIIEGADSGSEEGESNG